MNSLICKAIQCYINVVDAAVQTVESHYEDGYKESSVHRTRREDEIKEELEEKDGEKEDRTEESDSRVTELLEYSEQVLNLYLTGKCSFGLLIDFKCSSVYKVGCSILNNTLYTIV